MKVSLFKIGLGLVILGVVWISFVFVETEKTHGEMLLKQSTSFELNSEFAGSDIGYFKVYMPEFSGQGIFVQIQDKNHNVIKEQKTQTKMSVGYFDFNLDGIHTVKITNISDQQIFVQAEFGNTNSKEMIPAGVLILVGTITMVIMAYLKLKNYNIAQPDENIS